MGLGGEGDDVGELRDGREVAELGEPGEAEGVQAVAGEQSEIRVLRPHDAAGPVVLEVALDDGFDEQRVVRLAAGRARAGGRGGAELGREAVGVGERGGHEPPSSRRAAASAASTVT